MNRTMQRSGDNTDIHTYAYDAAGRLVKETVSYDGGEAVDVQKLSYNAIGTLSGNDLGVFNEEYTYNVRGAMTKRKSAVFEQNISFAGKYNGSIASISDQIADGLSMSGWYKYDKAGRLTQANMKVGGTPRFVDYTYDRNGNMTGDANKGLEMSWDYNNRLYKVEDDEMTMTFIRTGRGQKIGKKLECFSKADRT